MERWKVVARRRGSPLRLLNNNKTQIWVSPRASQFDLDKFLSKLQEIGFPLKYTRGLQNINFTILYGKRTFGQYEDGEVWVDVRKKHRTKTLVETFVHEVAHHLDNNDELSKGLGRERCYRAVHIHKIARESNGEYWARGFERFYSTDSRDRKDLKLFNPRLYKRIRALHNRYKRKPRVS